MSKRAMPRLMARLARRPKTTGAVAMGALTGGLSAAIPPQDKHGRKTKDPAKRRKHRLIAGAAGAAGGALMGAATGAAFDSARADQRRAVQGFARIRNWKPNVDEILKKVRIRRAEGGTSSLDDAIDEAMRNIKEGKGKTKMNSINFEAFGDELEKIAIMGAISKHLGSNKHLYHSGVELAGLGTLAVPSIHDLRDPNATAKDKSHAKYELAGLGILAAPEAYSLGSAAYRRMAGIKTAGVSLDKLKSLSGPYGQYRTQAKEIGRKVGTLHPSGAPVTVDYAKGEGGIARQFSRAAARWDAAPRPSEGPINWTREMRKQRQMKLGLPKTAALGVDAPRFVNPSALRSGRAGTMVQRAQDGVKSGISTPSIPKPKFTADDLRKAYSTSGIKPGLGSAAR